MINGEDGQGVYIIRGDEVGLPARSDGAEVMEPVTSGSVDRRHFDRLYGRDAKPDCRSYIMINVPLPQNIFYMFIVRAERKIFRADTVGYNAVYNVF